MWPSRCRPSRSWSQPWSCLTWAQRGGTCSCSGALTPVSAAGAAAAASGQEPRTGPAQTLQGVIASSVVASRQLPSSARQPWVQQHLCLPKPSAGAVVAVAADSADGFPSVADGFTYEAGLSAGKGKVGRDTLTRTQAAGNCCGRHACAYTVQVMRIILSRAEHLLSPTPPCSAALACAALPHRR